MVVKMKFEIRTSIGTILRYGERSPTPGGAISRVERTERDSAALSSRAADHDVTH
jgi:hypothetical protein